MSTYDISKILLPNGDICNLKDAIYAMPKTGGTFTGSVILSADPSNNLGAATKQYVDNHVSISNVLNNGTEIGILNIGNVSTTLYAPSTTRTIAVTLSSSTPTLEFVMGTLEESTATLTGVLSDTTAIVNGKIIFYMLPYPLPNTECTLTLTYGTTGTTTAAIPIYTYNNMRVKTPYPGGSILILLYYENKFYVVNNSISTIVGNTVNNTYINGDEVAY